LAPKIINPKEPRHHRTRSFRESLTPLLRLFPTTCRRRRESGPPSSPFDGDLSWTNRPVGQDESCSLLAASQAHNLLFVTINQPQTAVRCRVLCGSFWALLGMLPNQPGLVVRCLSSDADSPRRYYCTLLCCTIHQGLRIFRARWDGRRPICKPLARPANAVSLTQVTWCCPDSQPQPSSVSTLALSPSRFLK
jgi:hypothetical protein